MKNKSNYYQIKNLQQKNQKNNFNINKNKKGINIKENNLRKSIENNEIFLISVKRKIIHYLINIINIKTKQIKTK